MDIQMAEVTEIVLDKVKVRFNQDDIPSALEYPKLISYSPKIGDKVLMLKTNTSYICLGGIGAEAEEQKEDNNTVGEYKFFAKDKGLLWQGWAKCDGRELSGAEYPELYTEIGVTFGGGGGNFNLPNTTGRVLSDASGETFGSSAGSKRVTLTTSQMPRHNHALSISNSSVSGTSTNTRRAMESGLSGSYDTTGAIKDAGSGNSHENRQPTLYGGYYYIYTGGGIE